MYNPTEADRINALVAAVNRSDIAQGRPAEFTDRTAEDIGALCHGATVEADLDGNGWSTFWVVTLAEARELGIAYTDDDRIKVGRRFWVVVE